MIKQPKLANVCHLCLVKKANVVRKSLPITVAKDNSGKFPSCGEQLRQFFEPSVRHFRRV